VLIEKLPPRERQVFEALLALGTGTVADLQARIPDAPGGSAMRAMLARLERKGFVSHAAIDHQNIYRAKVPAAAARKSALSQLVRTFFDNSPAAAATALLGMEEQLDSEQLDALEALIRKAREEGSQ
jgi:predicted transcriptional regulator